MKILHVGPVETAKLPSGVNHDYDVYPGLVYDGPSQSIMGLVKALGNAGVEVGMLSTQSFNVDEQHRGTNVKFLTPYITDIRPPKYGRNPWEFQKYNPFISTKKWMALIDVEFGMPDIVNFHGVYDLFSCALAAELKRRNLKYIVTPRGGLRKLAQQNNRFKKQIANFLFFKRFIRDSILVHALSENEKKDILVFDRRLNVEVVPNGISKEFLSIGNKLPPPWKNADGRLVVGFLGQLFVIIKGIDLLFDAIVKLHQSGRGKNLRFLFAGPVHEPADRRWVEQLMSEIPDKDAVQQVGPKYGREKWEYLNNLDVLVLPSRTEGMPVVVLEAMVCGKPCLVSEGSSMRNIIEEAKAGWGFEGTVDSLFERLVEISNTPREKLLEYGLNGKAYVEKHLTWDRVVGRYLAMINKVLT